MTFRLTHYFRRPIDEAGWVPLAFVTRGAGDANGPYFLGFETGRALAEDDIQRREASGEVRRLDYPYEISFDQSLWLAPEGDVWLASETNPRADLHKLRIESGVARSSQGPMSSLGVRQAMETRSLPFLFGDYLNSRQSPNQVYSPHWQEHLTIAVADALREAAGSAAGWSTVTPSRLQEQEHKYAGVERLVVTGAVLLPYEMIFLSHPRRKAIDVVQLGNIADLALVYSQRGHAHRTLSLKPDEKCWPTCDEWIGGVQSTRTQVCVPTGTAADDLLYAEVAQRHLDMKLRHERLRVADLADWIGEERHLQSGVVICDIGIAHQLMCISPSELKLAVSFVPYPEPVPVGLAYRAEDKVWGDLVRHKMRDVYQSEEELVQKSLAETAHLAEDIGMTWEFPRYVAAA